MVSGFVCPSHGFIKATIKRDAILDRFGIHSLLFPAPLQSLSFLLYTRSFYFLIVKIPREIATCTAQRRLSHDRP